MSRTRKELYDRANHFYLNACIELVRHDPTFSLYEVTYKNDTYRFCICDRKSNYTGTHPKFHFRNKSEKLALNLCWKKLIEPSLSKN
ncbi:MAG: hypothetical protein COA80_19565 [Leeuwenhoekiella sp.]|nr:MAG: hypothetical protein COA80_19565 [Leeuwenhoekiella sp.]